jgi:small GTP-binding protein
MITFTKVKKNYKILKNYKTKIKNFKLILILIVIVVGDISVGKSSLLAKYVKGVFPSSPLPTIAIEFATKIIQLREGGYIKAQLWDTAGNEKYKSITS